jgi:hypothetical protein
MAEPLDDQVAAAREWEALLAEVRAIEGLDEFLRPPRLNPAVEGPVVVVNVGRERCDALIVTGERVCAVALPGLTRVDVEQGARTYLQAVHRFEMSRLSLHRLRRRLLEEDVEPEILHAYQDALQQVERTRKAMEVTLLKTLRWLWDTVAGPVIAALDPPSAAAKKPRRLWWCPTGLLTLLPLHAAGHHDEPGRSVLDHVVSSYTPSLRALAEAQRREPSGDGGMLVVALAEVEGQAPLPNVRAERVLLEELFAGERLTVLDELGATRAQVRSAIPAHEYFHFSCHGTQDLGRPSLAGLLLADGTLTIADLMADRFEAQFAFLSACKTATGGVSLSDEAITLASALHHLGCRHVIATLWSVYDAAAAKVTKGVCGLLTSEGGFVPDDTARALHQTILDLRRDHPGEPSVWIPFTHTGP